MRLRTGLALSTLAVAIVSCSESSITGPKAPDSPQLAVAAAFPDVRISEFHYDNASTDAGEAIEVSGPAGTDLTGWSLVLYNGSGGAVYNTKLLSGVLPATCDTRGVLTFAYPVNGIQNGNPDGIALVSPTGLVEFLSYGGTFIGVGGAAAGVLSTDVGVVETASTPIGSSLQRTGSDTWNAPAASTFDACNDNTGSPPPVVVIDRVTVTPEAATIEAGATQQFAGIAYDAANAPVAATLTWSSTAPAVASVNASGSATGLTPGSTLIIATSANGKADTATLQVNAPPPPPEVRFSEIHYDNFGTDINEAIEIEGPAGTVLTGWTVVLYNAGGTVAGQSYDTRTLLGNILLMCEGRGVVALTYPTDGIQNGGPDGFALVNAEGAVVEFLSYEGSFVASNGPAAGMSSRDIGVAESSSPVGQSLQRNALGVWLAPAPATVGACNSGVGPPPPPPGNGLSFSGRAPADVPLPVGFEDQLFATLRGPDGATILTTITWTTETPAIASIDADGVMRALGAGTAVVRATSTDGTTATYSLPTRIAVASTTAQYGSNTEFGEPVDGDASNDFIVRRDQFTSSWNDGLGTPNWVSYNLDATHFGSEDRCDCFTYDPLSPGASYTTADYTGASAFHGYAIDRGHLARSFDREAGSLDNATSFYFSNIIPQAADLNQGPWAVMEIYLGNLAQNQNREVYIIAGVFGSKGTIKDEGRITIPDSVWKVAVIMPRDQGIENVDDYLDIEVIAVIMPNDAGVRNVAWETYKRTVDDVEALTGYDLLALLRDDIEIAVESGTVPPVAALDGPYTSIEGESVAMSAALSSDADGDVLTYAWTFGDGGTATGVDVSRTYTTPGVYAVRLIATDVLGLADTVFTTATVISRAAAVESAIAIVDDLIAAGSISNGDGNSLNAKLQAAVSSLERGNLSAAAVQLGAALNSIESMEKTGKLSASDAASLRTIIERVIASMG